MCLIEFCPLNFLRLIWTLWSICGAWKLHSNTNLLKFFKNRCERLNQSGPRVSDFKTCNHPKAKNSSAPWICCNLLIIISSVTLIIFNWKWKRPVLGMPGTRGGSGMGFFRDPKSRDKNPGILGFLSQKNPKSENPKIPGFFGIGIDFFGISPGFLKISNSTSKMIVLYFRSINGIFC